MSWQVEFLPDAEQDMDELDGSVKRQVFKGIQKVSQNPLPKSQGGYGTPLGSRDGANLTNLLKIKFRDLGIRVVYKAIFEGRTMKILVVSVRTDEKVYKEAAKRRKTYNL